MTKTIYLDNAATSWPKPPEVLEAVQKFYEDAGGAAGRGRHRRAAATFELVADTRRKLARLLGVETPERIIYALNGTDALNMAVKGALRAGDHVIVTAADHNSILRPVAALARDGFITRTIVPVGTDGFVDPDEVRAAFTPRTRLVCCLHAGNVVGTLQPVAQIGTIAREHGALFLIDAAQTAGVVPLDVLALGADLVAMPGHKSLLGPPGTAALYVGPRAELKPWREGGTGADSISPTQPTDWPTWMEAGSPNTVGIAGLSAALDLVDPPATLARERRLVRRLWDALVDDDRFTLYGSPDLDRRVGVVSLNVTGLAPESVARELDRRYGIACRSGLHCAPLMHRALGTFPDGAVRFSPGWSSSEAHIDRTVEALRAIARRSAAPPSTRIPARTRAGG